MTYQPNIPLPTNAISQSQVDLNNNFQQLNVGFAVDHNAYNVANAGQHKKVLFTNVAADPVIVNPAGQLYTKQVSGVIQAFFSNGTTVSQLTGLPQDLVSEGSVTFGAGLILKWGTKVTVGSNSVVVTFPVAFPNNCFNVQITPVLSAVDTTEKTVAVRDATIAVTGFRTQQSSTAIGSIFWFAIGN